MRLADEGGYLSDKQPCLGGQRGGRTVRAADGVRRRAPVRRGTIARALRIDLSRVGRIAQNPADCRARPAWPAQRRRYATLVEMPGQLHQRGPGLTVQGKQLGNNGGLGGVGHDASRVARPVRVQAIAVGWICPGQQQASAQLGQPSPAHALGNQRALVLGDCAADLQQQVIVRIVAHWAVQKLDEAVGAGPFFQQHHLVYIVAREAVGRGHEHAVDLVPLHGIAQAIKPRARQNGAAVPLVPEDVGRVEDPALSGMHLHVRRKPVELLLNRLMLDLMAGRDTAVDRDPHGAPPAG